MKKGFLILVILLIPQLSSAQVSASLNGYVSNMQSVVFENIQDPWQMDNLFHNRLNFSFYGGRWLSTQLEVRNRFMYGATVQYVPGYKDLIDHDSGWADLSWNLLSDTSYLFNSTIDRANIDLTFGAFQATIGRQRINWGMNYVWNPNDIFNSYSFFDFDYVERPGSDAVRLQLYLNSTASIEAVAKINEFDAWSLAGLMRFTVLGSDFQFLGGLLNEEEFVIGAGFFVC